MTADGFNPLRWKCAVDGCFNIKRRPKIEVFADCFPRRINFGDVDGLVEYDGSFCLLEWKGDEGHISTGQRRSFVAFSKLAANIVVIAQGNAESMIVTRHAYFVRGTWHGWFDGDLGAIKALLRRWIARDPVLFA